MKNLSTQTKFNLAFLVLLVAIFIYQIVLHIKIEKAYRNAAGAWDHAEAAKKNTEQIKERLNIY